MNYSQAIFYGALQGLCEFLPISSSGHLALAHSMFELSGSDGLSFDIFLHLATLLAVMLMYMRELSELLRAFPRLIRRIFSGGFSFSELEYGERLLLLLLAGSLPLALALPLKDRVEALSRLPRAVGSLMLANSALLMLPDIYCRRRSSAHERSLSACRVLDALTVGFFQLMAIVPGLSRSGVTTVGGIFCGMERSEAVRFSFLLSIPAVLAANISNLPELLGGELIVSGAHIAAFLAALLTGVAAIGLFRLISRRGGFLPFVIYTAIVGALVIGFG